MKAAKIRGKTWLLALGVILGTSGCGQMEPETLSEAKADAANLSMTSEPNTTPTGWWWYHGVTPNQLKDKIRQKGGRLVDLQVESVSPFRVSAAMVKNKGTHARTWWWYYGLTAGQLTDKINQLNARIVRLDTYLQGGNRRFAAVLVKNTGSDSKAWWWYYGLTPSQVTTKLRDNGARLVDLRPYVEGGKKKFAIVMIRNSGADGRSWWWYHGISGNQIGQKARSHRAKVMDVEREPSGRYSVLLMRPKSSYASWYYYNVKRAFVKDRYMQNGARIARLTSWGRGSNKRFAVVMVNNSNRLTTRIGRILRQGLNQYDGFYSFYLKRSGQNTLAALDRNRPMEPASALKALHNLAAARDIGLDTRELTDMIPWSNLSSRTDDPSTTVDEAKDGCLDGFPPNSTIQLGQAMRQMMRISDNRATEGVRRLYGFTGLNNLGSAINLTKTEVNHRIGCAGPVRNEFSTRDAGVLYESVDRGTSISQTEGRNAFWNAMSSSTGFLSIINSEIDRLVNIIGGTTAERTANRTRLRNQFRSRVITHSKGGSYDICQPGSTNCYPRELTRAGAGRVRLPWKRRNGRVAMVSYVYAVFMDNVIVANATQRTAAINARSQAANELLRDEIRKALKTFK